MLNLYRLGIGAPSHILPAALAKFTLALSGAIALIDTTEAGQTLLIGTVVEERFYQR